MMDGKRSSESSQRGDGLMRVCVMIYIIYLDGRFFFFNESEDRSKKRKERAKRKGGGFKRKTYVYTYKYI